MQSSEIISVNIWQIAVSLLNLVILFFILKRFLFKPVNKILSERQADIDAQFDRAQSDRREAENAKNELSQRLDEARERADRIVQEAKEQAEAQGEKILTDARDEARRIVRQAKADAELERKRAQGEIKLQIVDISSALAKKLVEREIKIQEHRELIDAFISEMGDDGN